MTRRTRQWWTWAGIVAQLSVAVGARPSGAGPVEHVISFDSVVVTFPGEVVEQPEAAHATLEAAEGVAAEDPDADGTDPTVGPTRPPTFGRTPDISREGRLLDAALEHKLIELSGPWILFKGSPIGRGRANAKRRLAENPRLFQEIETEVRHRQRLAAQSDTRDPAPRVARALPLAFAPGQPVAANPSFVQHGFRVESFWAVRTGSPEGYYTRAHFHPPDLVANFEGQHFGGPTELHGLHIRALDGQPFGLRSLRYRVTRNRHLPGQPRSIEGFNNFAVYVLVGRSFDPRKSVRSQFTALPVGLALGNDPALPWFSLPVLGFEYVEELFIASSASVDLDDIVLVRIEADPPAPALAPAPDDERPATP
jgi:hypothetical protein